MLRPDPLRLARIGFALGDFMQPQVAPGVPLHLAAGAPVDDHARDGFAAARGECFVGDALQRKRLAAAHLFVAGDEGCCADVDDPLVQRLRREAAEHDRMRRADAGAGLHRDNAFDRHRHVDHDPVAFLDAALLERIRAAAYALEQVLVRDVSDRAVVRFEDHRDPFTVAGFDVTVEAVVGRVQLAVFEPCVERCVRLVENLGEWLFPGHRLACETPPEALIVMLGLGDQRPVSAHSRNLRLGNQLGRRGKDESFVDNRFDD